MVPKCFTTKAFSFSVQLANCVRYWSPLPHRKHCLPWTSGLLVDSLLAVNILLYISLQLDYDVLEYNFFVYLGIQFFCLPCVFMLSVEQWTSGVHFASC